MANLNLEERLFSLLSANRGRNLNENDMSLALMLILSGLDCNPNLVGSIGNTILFEVVKFDDVQMLKEFINAGCNMHWKNDAKRKAIDVACDCYALNVVEWFLKNGIDANEIVDKDGKTRLHKICSIEHKPSENIEDAIALINLFSGAGASFLKKDSAKHLPLHFLNIRLDLQLHPADKILYEFVKVYTFKELKGIDLEEKQALENEYKDLDDKSNAVLIEIPTVALKEVPKAALKEEPKADLKEIPIAALKEVRKNCAPLVTEEKRTLSSVSDEEENKSEDKEKTKSEDQELSEWNLMEKREIHLETNSGTTSETDSKKITFLQKENKELIETLRGYQKYRDQLAEIKQKEIDWLNEKNEKLYLEKESANKSLQESREYISKMVQMINEFKDKMDKI